jgi:hypothetical protein
MVQGSFDTEMVLRLESDRRLEAAFKAGLFAGLFMLVVETTAAGFFGYSYWLPYYLVSAVVLGPDVLSSMDTFSVSVMLSAIAIYFPLSIVYAVAFANVAFRFGPNTVILAGAFYGLALYIINFYVFTELWYWLQVTRSEVNIAAHILYGVILASSYKARAYAPEQHFRQQVLA